MPLGKQADSYQISGQLVRLSETSTHTLATLSAMMSSNEMLFWCFCSLAFLSATEIAPSISRWVNAHITDTRIKSYWIIHSIVCCLVLIWIWFTGPFHNRWARFVNVSSRHFAHRSTCVLSPSMNQCRPCLNVLHSLNADALMWLIALQSLHFHD